MSGRILVEHAADFGEFRTIKAAGGVPFRPVELEHAYIKLDFEHQYENARTAEDAKLFLKSVARAALTTHGIVQHYGGELLEVQGSMIHAGLPVTHDSRGTSARDFVTTLHAALQVLYAGSSRVQGWRMTVDAGKTLVVAGRGAHGDDSWVSLGPAANRPAKHLYAQLERPEERRELKRFHAGFYDAHTNRWTHIDLDRSPQGLGQLKSIAERARRETPTLRYIEAIGGERTVLGKMAPMGTPGTPASPTADRPHTYFGWVMRSDLDGFSARVAECLGDDHRLQELATDFYRIMDTAAAFVALHSEDLAQLPWAGDNFTASAVFRTHDEYQNAASKRLVELCLDFEKEMNEAAEDGGFGGWAHGIAGGAPHRNAGGNVYLAGVEIEGRRFLVGAGEGFGRSAHAFGDVNPDAEQLVVYRPDWNQLDAAYKDVFKPAVNTRGQQSTLFWTAKVPALQRSRARIGAAGTASVVTFAGSRAEKVEPRPYFR